MKKIIFMGKSGCGKTTICQRLCDIEIKYRKTQTTTLFTDAIDTPGEYLENRHYYSALITASADARIIGVIADPLVKENYIPPTFAMTFARPVIGIITKISVADKDGIERAEKALKTGGISKIFKIDSIQNIGLYELFSYIKGE